VTEPRPTRTPARAYIVAVVTVAAATAGGLLASPFASHADQAMLYMLAVVVAALGGRGAGLTAVVLSAAAFDFFFVEPYHTFAVADHSFFVTFGVMLAVADHSFFVTFGVMLAVGIAIGSLVNCTRVAEARSHERELRAKAEELRKGVDAPPAPPRGVGAA
jgi:K+-sensing histidine kinase KdpD